VSLAPFAPSPTGIRNGGRRKNLTATGREMRKGGNCVKTRISTASFGMKNTYGVRFNTSALIPIRLGSLVRVVPKGTRG
jgi:hypothetical protein